MRPAFIRGHCNFYQQDLFNRAVKILHQFFVVFFLLFSHDEKRSQCRRHCRNKGDYSDDYSKFAFFHMLILLKSICKYYAHAIHLYNIIILKKVNNLFPPDKLCLGKISNSERKELIVIYKSYFPFPLRYSLFVRGIICCSAPL